MFPFSVDGRTRLQSSQDDGQVLKALQARLDTAGASWSTIRGDAVIFRVGFFHMRGNWNILVPYDRGEIRIVRQQGEAWLAYRNSTRRMLATVTGMAVFIALCLGASQTDPVFGLMMFGAAWLWLFGLNYLIAAARFGGWLSRAA